MLNLVLVISVSVTLRDAQHLCWKNFRKINDKLDPEKGKKWTPLMMVTEMLEQTSKLANDAKNHDKDQVAEKSDAKAALASELSNLLYMIFVLAEHYGIELEESFLQSVNDQIISMLK